MILVLFLLKQIYNLLKKSFRATFKPLKQTISRLQERESILMSTVSSKRGCIIKNNRPNNCFRLKSGEIILVNSLEASSQIVKYRIFRIRDNLFTSPLNSSNLGIFVVSKLSSIKQCNINDFECKCWLMPMESSNQFTCYSLWNCSLIFNKLKITKLYFAINYLHRFCINFTVAFLL